ncbi:alpha/beta fold hydrolase [Phormidium sp. CLA17]|uniref:alpha/beta fold hydrolase n=1 Tax=Leptolyngbya sp. Cla-17 TaxID=2803751 RepID=UPI0014921148|nr:alpha/beta fold hydrolase [Leptolyngbya sp. Cla-17]MBM0743618.1 alpha/beta fold hydrolase [Leptolyngbya sp. Cla-17]
MRVMESAVAVPGQFWEWRGQQIYYVKAGERHSDRPPLLLIHGFGASTDHWRKNVVGLSDEFEVWAIDLLGFGRSAKPDWQYSGDLWRDQLHDFVTEVMGQPAVLVGNSLGGYAALCVASQRPTSAAGLVLVNSAGPFTDLKATPPKPDPVREVMGAVIRSLFQQDWASYLLFQYVRQKFLIRRTLEKVYLDQSAVTDRLVEEIYQPSCDPGAPKVFASVFRTPQGEKVDVLLGQLTCPLLMLWGEGDPWINARDRGAKFREYYPQLTEYYLQAGHCPHDEVPDQVNELLRSWVSAL